MKDEYGLGVILAQHGVNSDNLLPLLNEQLDKVCGNYMVKSDKIKQAAFTEIKCFLLKAIIDSEDDSKLKSRINKIIESL